MRFKYFITFLISAFLFLNTGTAHAKLFQKNTKKIKPEVQKVQKTDEKKETPHKKVLENNKTNYEELLEMTDEQKNIYSQIRRNEFEQISPIIEKIKIKHEELEKLLQTELPPMLYDVEEVKIRTELRKYKAEIKAIKLENEEKIETILTPKQKNKYKKLKEASYKTPANKTPARSMGSVSKTTEFVYEPCNTQDGVPACKIDDLLKKQQDLNKK